MPYHVAKSAQCPASKPWGVINSVTGDVGGRCHPSQAKARKQMAALYANEPGINMTDAPRDSLIRANLANDAATVDGRTMTGYPIVFNRWTTIDSWEGTFKERIAPGALERTLRNSRNQIKVLFNHGMDPSIGNKPLGKPSVMRTDEQGLYAETPLSDTSYNNDLLALMRDGAIDGQSFRFSVIDETWDKTNTKMPERTITELRLFEFGPVTFPAYQATTVGIRSREDFAAWCGLDDERREQIAAIMSTDLRTSENWLAETGTQEFGLAPSNNTNGSLTKHPGVPSSTFRRAQERVTFLRRLTEDARSH